MSSLKLIFLRGLAGGASYAGAPPPAPRPGPRREDADPTCVVFEAEDEAEAEGLRGRDAVAVFLGDLPSFSIFAALSAARSAFSRMTRSICSWRSASVCRATGTAADDFFEPLPFPFSGVPADRRTGI